MGTIRICGLRFFDNETTWHSMVSFGPTLKYMLERKVEELKAEGVTGAQVVRESWGHRDFAIEFPKHKEDVQS